MELEITVDDLKAALDRGAKITLLDVREPWEYEVARVAGGKLMPMGDVRARAHQELDEDDHIVVLCHHGVRSMHVANWLRQQGFDKAQSLRGGIDRWSRAVDSSVPLY